MQHKKKNHVCEWGEFQQTYTTHKTKTFCSCSFHDRALCLWFAIIFKNNWCVNKGIHADWFLFLLSLTIGISLGVISIGSSFASLIAMHRFWKAVLEFEYKKNKKSRHTQCFQKQRLEYKITNAVLSLWLKFCRHSNSWRCPPTVVLLLPRNGLKTLVFNLEFKLSAFWEWLVGSFGSTWGFCGWLCKCEFQSMLISGNWFFAQKLSYALQPSELTVFFNKQ